MRTERRGEKEASEYLRSLGIKGIRYKDALSRDGEGTTSNYVMFDDSLIDIKDKYSRRAKSLAKEQGFDVDNIYYHGTASSQPIKNSAVI